MVSACAEETVDDPFLLRYEGQGRCSNEDPGEPAPVPVEGPVYFSFYNRTQVIISGLRIAGPTCNADSTNVSKAPIREHTETSFRTDALSGRFVRGREIDTDCGQVRLYDLELTPPWYGAATLTGSYRCKD